MSLQTLCKVSLMKANELTLQMLTLVVQTSSYGPYAGG